MCNFYYANRYDIVLQMQIEIATSRIKLTKYKIRILLYLSFFSNKFLFMIMIIMQWKAAPNKNIHARTTSGATSFAQKKVQYL